MRTQHRLSTLNSPNSVLTSWLPSALHLHARRTNATLQGWQQRCSRQPTPQRGPASSCQQQRKVWMWPENTQHTGTHTRKHTCTPCTPLRRCPRAAGAQSPQGAPAPPPHAGTPAACQGAGVAAAQHTHKHSAGLTGSAGNPPPKPAAHVVPKRPDAPRQPLLRLGLVALIERVVPVVRWRHGALACVSTLCWPPTASIFQRVACRATPCPAPPQRCHTHTHTRTAGSAPSGS